MGWAVQAVHISNGRARRAEGPAHHAHVVSRMELGAALPHDDVAGDAPLPAKQLDAQVLGVGVLGVLRGAALLLGGKAQLLPLRARCRRRRGRTAAAALGCRGAPRCSGKRGACKGVGCEHPCSARAALQRALTAGAQTHPQRRGRLPVVGSSCPRASMLLSGAALEGFAHWYWRQVAGRALATLLGVEEEAGCRDVHPVRSSVLSAFPADLAKLFPFLPWMHPASILNRIH